MENIKRTQGFIELDELGKDPSFRLIPWQENESMLEEYGHSHIKYIFYYQNEIYLYKLPDFKHQCYYELIAEELAHDFGIPSAHYDLAYKHLGEHGVISKFFKLPNFTYFKGYDILKDYVKNCLYKTKNLSDYDIDEKIEKYNCLEGIWAAFEYRYLNHPNRTEIVNNLMNQLVDIFIYDVLTGHTDRHEENWGIAENDSHISLQPLFDNERLLFMDNDFRFSLETDNSIPYNIKFQQGIKNLLHDFLTVSSSNFVEKFKEKVPLIAKENIEKILIQIEERTKAPIPPNIKTKVIKNFKTMEILITTTLNEYEENKKTR